MTADTALTYRRAGVRDADAAAGVLKIALDDLGARQNRPPSSTPAQDMIPVLRHLVQTDGERFWVAADGDDAAGFGCGMVRGGLWFLAALFVLPQWQGRGVGRALLERAIEGFPIAGGALAVISGSTNPVSNTLYARHGMYPWLPAISMTARLTGDQTRPALGTLEVAPVEPADLADLHAVDDAVIGFDRSRDHTWLVGEAGRPGWVFRRRGRPAGYVYLYGDGSEGRTHIGPLAAVRPQDQAPMLRFALAEIAARGAQSASLLVPGPNRHAQRTLWEAGFAFGGSAGLLGVSRPFARFDRYLFAGDALM